MWSLVYFLLYHIVLFLRRAQLAHMHSFILSFIQLLFIEHLFIYLVIKWQFISRANN